MTDAFKTLTNALLLGLRVLHKSQSLLPLSKNNFDMYISDDDTTCSVFVLKWESEGS